MTIAIHEKFQVAAPPSAVWQFMLSPQNVIGCMPGAALTEVVDAKQFLASVKVKIGAVTAQYQGRVTYVEADAEHFTLRLLAEGAERGGGTVQATIDTRLEALEGGTITEVVCDSNVELTGRIVQVGRGMIEGVAAQIIKRYVANVKAQIEPAAAAAAAAPATTAPTGDVAAQGAAPTLPAAAAVAAPPQQEPLNAFGLVLRVMWERLCGALRGLFGRR